MTIIQWLFETIGEVREWFRPIGREFVPVISGAADRWADEEGVLRRVDRVCHDRLRPSADSVDCRPVVSRAGETQEGRGSWCRV